VSYQPLTLKYRPQTVHDLVGQESVKQTLIKAFESNRIANAYLLTGPRGSGKTSSARIIAKSINCLNKPAGTPTSEPCGKCRACLGIASSSDLDVIEIDAASHGGVDDARGLVEKAALAPVYSDYKIFIIDEVHMLSNAAFNALLKLFEEPPHKVLFILATTEENKVLPTITSRCQQFRFKPISIENCTKRLSEICIKEHFKFSKEALNYIAEEADGALRDSLSILDQLSPYADQQLSAGEVAEILGNLDQETLAEIISCILKQDHAATLTKLAEATRKSASSINLAIELFKYWLKVLEHQVLNNSESQAVKQSAVALTEQNLSKEDLLAVTKDLSELEADLRLSSVPAALLKARLVSLCARTDVLTLEKRLSELESKLSNAPQAAGSTRAMPPKTTYQSSSMPRSATAASHMAAPNQAAQSASYAPKPAASNQTSTVSSQSVASLAPEPVNLSQSLNEPTASNPASASNQATTSDNLNIASSSADALSTLNQSTNQVSTKPNQSVASNSSITAPQSAPKSPAAPPNNSNISSFEPAPTKSSLNQPESPLPSAAIINKQSNLESQELSKEIINYLPAATKGLFISTSARFIYIEEPEAKLEIAAKFKFLKSKLESKKADIFKAITQVTGKSISHLNIMLAEGAAGEPPRQSNVKPARDSSTGTPSARPAPMKNLDSTVSSTPQPASNSAPTISTSIEFKPSFAAGSNSSIPPSTAKTTSPSPNLTTSRTNSANISQSQAPQSNNYKSAAAKAGTSRPKAKLNLDPDDINSMLDTTVVSYQDSSDAQTQESNQTQTHSSNNEEIKPQASSNSPITASSPPSDTSQEALKQQNTTEKSLSDNQTELKSNDKPELKSVSTQEDSINSPREINKDCCAERDVYLDEIAELGASIFGGTVIKSEDNLSQYEDN
jgi:DNA polymerase-3 subunit gamma/tau